MKIIINNSNREKTVFYLENDKSCSWKKKEIKSSKDISLLEMIEKVLNFYDKKINDLTGIAVILGYGGFTGERIATTVANSLGFILQIKIIGITEFTTEPDKLEDKDFDNIDIKFANSSKGVYISAKYSGSPNIGKK